MEILDNDIFRGGLFAAVGFTVLACLLFHHIRRARYAAKVTAIVTHDCRRGNRRNVYRPVYEYHVEGSIHKVASRWGGRSRIAKDGTEVTLYYIPDRPEKIYAPLEARGFLGLKVFLLIFGTTSFVLGIGLAVGLIDG